MPWRSPAFARDGAATEFEYVTADLDLVAAVEADTDGALDSYAVDPDPVTGGVDHQGLRELGIHPDLEVIARDGEIVTHQDPMRVVHPRVFAAHEEPVQQGPGGLVGAPGVDDDVTEGRAVGHRPPAPPVTVAPLGGGPTRSVPFSQGFSGTNAKPRCLDTQREVSFFLGSRPQVGGWRDVPPNWDVGGSANRGAWWRSRAAWARRCPDMRSALN